MATIEELYKACRAHGATAIQASAAGGNAVSEVGPDSPVDLKPDTFLNPEYDNPGCIGCWCWEPEFFNPPRPTGNQEVDLDNQVAYLERTGGFVHAFGADAETAGRNFALTYERCAQCYVGGLEWVKRGQQAAEIFRMAQANGWDVPVVHKSMHYERYWRPEMATCAKRYDVLREKVHTGKITEEERKWFAERQHEAGEYVTRIYDEAVRKGSKNHPNYGEHRGWLEQQMILRRDGKRCEPTE